MATAQKKIFFLGTSITKDDAGGNCSYRTKALMAYPNLIPAGGNNDFVCENLFVGPLKIQNQGNNGQTVATAASLLATIWTLIGGAHITVLELSINDLIVGTPSSSLANVPNVLTAYGNFLDLFPALTPAVAGFKILPMQIYNTLYQGGAWNAVVTAFNAGLPALQASRTSFVAPVGTFPTLTAAQFGDGQMIHPNQSGHEAGARLGLIPALAALV